MKVNKVAAASGAVLTVIALAAMTACGQKGPLYLPDTGGEVVTRPGTTAPANQTPGTGPQASPQPSTQAPPQPTDGTIAKPEAEKKNQTPR